jgi:GT2 family glycosyltransferase
LDCGRPEDTAKAVSSVLDPSLAPRVLVVENGPGPAPALPVGVDVLRLPENRGYAAGMNAGLAALRRAGCDRVLLLNNDAVLDAGCLRALAEALEDPSLAGVGPVVLKRADGRVESVGASFDPRTGRNRLLGHGRLLERRQGRLEVTSLSGAAWMLRASAAAQIGPLDEACFFSFEETEWCLRARRGGFRLAVVLGAVVRHAGSQTLGLASSERLYYAARNHLWIAARHAPLRALAGWVRSGLIVGRNLAHALRQKDVARPAALSAVLRGAADFYRGRFGQAGPR